MTAMGTTAEPARTARDPSQVELILSQIDSLPTLPEVAMRLLALTDDHRSSARQAIELIESDQSLSARLLSMVNRAHVGSRAETVDRAVVLLGFEALRSLVLSMQVFETFSHRAEPSGGRLDRVAFWKHSLAVGCAARLVAEHCVGEGGKPPEGWPRVEEAFTCGLLHDLGKVALDACFPKSYDRAISRCENVGGSLADAEREVFGLDHTIAGQRLATHWKLPAMIRESIWLHHHAPSATPTRLECPHHVKVVQLADRLARHLRIGYSGTKAGDTSLQGIAVDTNVPVHQLEKAAAGLPGLIEARATLIGLNEFTSADVYHEALAKTNAELGRVNQSLSQTNRRLELRSRCFEALRALNTDLGDEPTHEEVCRAGVRAVGLVLSAGPVAICAMSPRRSLAVLVSSRSEGEPHVNVLPGEAVGGVPDLTDQGEGWLATSVLPKALLDHVTGEMGQAPSCCWAVRYQNRQVALIMAASDPLPEADEPVRALSDALGLWLSAAEARVLARQLNEELAEMNRRVVDSQAEVARVRSLAMVGEMAAGAAHELNNPLAVISGRAQLLDHEGLPEEVRRAAGLMAEHAHRASEIVTDLMDFAKPTPPQPSDFALPALLGEIRREWIEKSSLTQEQFELQLSDDVPLIRADAVQIRRLFDEVIRNAVEAMHDVSAPCLVINCQAELADDMVVVRVRDNGIGMTPEVLERAMTPFYSHRPAGRSRGLGLSRAARYADINGGRIRLASREGEGTAVLIALPTVARR